ncbi:regulatory protein RecX [Zafaria sp. Z1313]|uniref:regulatory protein RecX n=1 Tax=unclassified Zafaria TaxID=2828765 RepID=UPI002E798E4A|nr:regulatory protein RecX [Zafaria sp. J156]MEE1621971.1 regulatory protein RecX [Zafaria sp. J156]
MGRGLDWGGLGTEGDGTDPSGTPRDRDLPGDRRGPGVHDRSGDRRGPDAHDRSGAAADPEAQARAIVLRQLTGSAKSRRQLEDKLAARGISPAVAGGVLDRFEELGLVDDATFAASWVAGRSRSRGLARTALRRELAEKGIDPELAEAALEQLDDEDEDEQARELVRKRLRTGSAGGDRDTQLRRLVGMLARKGHAPGRAYRVASEVLDES